MNQSTKLRSCFALATLFAVAWLLSGCIWPHTTERSREVNGRVLDAKTRLPIKRAKVAFCDPPHHTTYTDVDGNFRMKAAKNFHWLVGADGSGFPNRKANGICITHEGYLIEDFWPGYDKDPMNILLEPKP
jgi:hypothetical protein